ncbi:MAG: cupin domain-containing protein [Acidobacteriota bacterium]|jgi:mannose-6-phosphate isomerase-like protein (cupin superfamily)
MENLTIRNQSRRNFLCTAPVAAAAGIALADVFARPAAAQGAQGKFQLFTAKTLADDLKALEAAPGNNNLVTDPGVVVILTVEKDKSAKEFEWHEHRDHIFQIHEGSTVYELGGTPKNGRNIRPGEWLAPESDGAQKVTLHKGDMLLVPRGTPHRRTTHGSVTLTLISAQDAV